MDKSSTTKSQKIVIWVILIFMTVGSVGAYFVTIIANNNANDKDLQQQDQERLMREYQDKIKKQQEAEAKKKKEPLDGYEATAFDKASVTELQAEVIKEGEGKEAVADSTVEADYFGWTSDGNIFDSSKKDGVTKSASFSLSSVIKGWTEGLAGKKEGSVIKLTIPSDKAYGETGSPPSIGANEPLMFIVILKKVQ